MKRLDLLGVLLLVMPLLSNMARADDTVRVSGRFIGGLGAGGALLVNGFSSAYSTGRGLDGYLGFSIDKNWSAMLAIDSFIFDTGNANTYDGEFNLAPSLKYAFGDSPIRFYLIGGLGVNESISYFKTNVETASASQGNFVIEPGAGVEIYLDNALDLYIQAKYIDVFAASEFSYVPITVGLNFK